MNPGIKIKSIIPSLTLFLLFFQTPSFAIEDKWQTYIDGSVGKPLYYLYDQVMYGSFRNKQNLRALNLGSGSGDVDFDLAAKKWDVTSTDTSPRTGEILKERISYINGSFEFQLTDFDNVNLKGTYDLVLSFFALPFGNKLNLPELVTKLNQHMKKDAVFVATFFGNEHTFVINGNAYGITKDELITVLSANNFQIRYFLNRRFNQSDLKGESIHWDVLDVIAVKL